MTFRENDSFYPPTFGACHPSSSTTPISRIGREGENVVGRDVLIRAIPALLHFATHLNMGKV